MYRSDRDSGRYTLRLIDEEEGNITGKKYMKEEVYGVEVVERMGFKKIKLAFSRDCLGTS